MTSTQVLAGTRLSTSTSALDVAASVKLSDEAGRQESEQKKTPQKKKISQLITFEPAVFMYKFHNNLLPSVFDPYFNSVRILHNYNTNLSSKMTKISG